MIDDTADRERFQRDLHSVEDGDPITNFTNELLGVNQPFDTYQDPSVMKELEVSQATIDSAKTKEDFFKSDLTDSRVQKNSKLKREFDRDEIKMLYALALSIDYRDNNQKSDMLTEYMKKKGFVCLGTGTNRVSYKKGHYVYKIALDRRGIADNLNEARRSADAPQFLAHCFECCGVAAVCEYVDVLDRETFANPKVRESILMVLKELSKEFIFGDMGYDPKNFANIGIRRSKEGESLVFLDFAYMHPRLGNEDAFTCIKDGTPLQYNRMFTRYICPKCKSEFDYRDILWRINSNTNNFESAFLSDVQSNLDLDLDNLAIDADV